ncbi:MAG: hypothetical protein HN348_11180, partial [Proteobacteria bacterium]|nr:hypothetical protein [Pseudomonadota bacterium]
MGISLRELTGRLESARQSGVRALEFMLTESEGISLLVQRGKVVCQEPVTEERLKVRCWVDGGGTGTAAGSVKRLDQLVAAALVAAGKAPANAFAAPVGRLDGSSGGLGIDDRRYSRLTTADKMDVVVAAERSARSTDRRLITGDFEYEDRRSRRVLINSKGAVWEEWDTIYHANGIVRSGAGDLKISSGVDGRTFAGVASMPYGTVLGARMSALLKKGPTISGPIPVLLPPLATGRLVARLGEEFHPRQLAEKKTFFSRSSDGPLVDKRLHLIDDGRLVGALMTRGFDDRGVPAVPLTLLCEG